MTKSALMLAIVSVSLTGCNPTSTPLIDMCQKITQNLVGPISEWQEPQKSEGARHATVLLNYTADSGETGTASCKHPLDKSNDNYRIAPESMALNGAPVGTKDLISASFGATKQIVKDTAVNTKEKSVQLANDASEKAKEMASQAQVMAEDAKVKAAELAVKAESLAGDAQVKARELAEQAKIHAGGLAEKASELTAQAKEKARVAALEAAQNVQEKLQK